MHIEVYIKCIFHGLWSNKTNIYEPRTPGLEDAIASTLEDFVFFPDPLLFPIRFSVCTT